MLLPTQPNLRFLTRDSDITGAWWSAHSAGAETSLGLSAVRRYIEVHGGTSLRFLEPVAGIQRIHPLPLAFSLDLASAADAQELLRALREDPLVLAADVSNEFTFPTPPMAIFGLPVSPEANVARSICRFDIARFPVTCEGTRIAVIDAGEPDHELLVGVLDYYGMHSAMQKQQVHGTAVTGVLAAKLAGGAMVGCCNARVAYFNAWTDSGSSFIFERDFYVRALLSFLASDMRVLNHSLSSTKHDDVVAWLFGRAEELGKVVVCALPATRHPYPAAFDSVVRVGKFKGGRTSPTGLTASVSAPGTGLWLLDAEASYRPGSGSSFAAPAVSAALWLAAMSCPNFSPADLRDMLIRTVRGLTTTPHSNIGYGLLDAHALGELVKAHCSCR